MPNAPSAPPPKSTAALTWLLLGDPHLGPRHHGAAGFEPAKLADALCEDIRALCLGEVDGAVDLVLVVGDLVPEPSAPNYAGAYAWLERVARCAGVDAARVLAVPGNHDVDRARVEREVELVALHDTVRARPDRTERVSPAYDAVLGRAFEGFASLASRVAQPTDAGGWPLARPHFAHVVKPHGHAVRLVGWNTAWLSDEADTKGTLAAPAAMVHAAMAGGDDEIVVLLAHHPLEWLARGEAIRAAIESRVHLALSAHAHEPELAPPARSAAGMLSLAVGGLSSDDAVRGSVARHRYAICRLEIGFQGPVLRVWARSSPVDAPAFAPDTAAYGEPHRGESWALPLRPPGEGWLSYRDVEPAPVPAHRVAHEQLQSEQGRRKPSLPPRPASIPPPPAPPANSVSVASNGPAPAASYEPPSRPRTTGRRAAIQRATLLARLPPMPLAPEALIGREDVLARLGARLAPNGSLRIAGLVGGPGEGKTAIALAFATSARERGEFPGGVFWFDAALADPLDEGLRLLASHYAPLGSDVAPLAPDPAPLETVLTALGPGTAPALLVFDGLRTPQALVQLRAAFGTTSAAVLYTAEYPPASGDASALPVAPLSLDAAVALLQHASGLAADGASYARIAKLVGRNALALGIAARMVNGLDGLGRVIDELARAIGAGSATTAAAHFSLFERRWPRVAPPVRNAWLLCAACNADAPVPWPWLASALRTLGATEAEADGAAGALAREAGAVMSAHGDAVRLHPSAHVFARGRLKTLDDTERNRLGEAFARGACAALEAALPRFDTAACVRALPHIETLLAIGEHAGPETAAKLAGVAALAAIRAGGVGHVERVRSVLETALSAEAMANPAWCDHAIELLNAFVELDTSRAAHGDPSAAGAELSEREARLAILLRSQGTRDAIERARQLFERSIARESQRAPSSLVVASRRLELARALLDLGSVEALQTARGQLEQVLAAAETAGPPGASMVQRVGVLALEIDSSLRSAQAAGLRR